MEALILVVCPGICHGLVHLCLFDLSPPTFPEFFQKLHPWQMNFSCKFKEIHFCLSDWIVFFPFGYFWHCVANSNLLHCVFGNRTKVEGCFTVGGRLYSMVAYVDIVINDRPLYHS